MTGIGDFIITVYTAVGLLLVGVLYLLLRKRTWRLFVVIPPLVLIVGAAAAPYAEESIIARHFAEACNQAGVHIVRKVEVDGFYDSIWRSGYEYIDRHGYAWMEHASPDGKRIEHLERVHGKWENRVLEQPTRDTTSFNRCSDACLTKCGSMNG